MPTTSPSAVTSGPPELPGIHRGVELDQVGEDALAVGRAVLAPEAGDHAGRGRRADAERESRPRPPGRRAAGRWSSASSPAYRSSGIVFACSTARSCSGCAPITSASASRPSANMTLIALRAVHHVQVGEDDAGVDDHHAGADVALGLGVVPRRRRRRACRARAPPRAGSSRRRRPASAAAPPPRRQRQRRRLRRAEAPTTESTHQQGQRSGRGDAQFLPRNGLAAGAALRPASRPPARAAGGGNCCRRRRAFSRQEPRGMLPAEVRLDVASRPSARARRVRYPCVRVQTAALEMPAALPGPRLIALAERRGAEHRPG